MPLATLTAWPIISGCTSWATDESTAATTAPIRYQGCGFRKAAKRRTIRVSNAMKISSASALPRLALRPPPAAGHVAAARAAFVESEVAHSAASVTRRRMRASAMERPCSVRVCSW